MKNTRLSQKHKSGWVTFACKKAMWNISLAIKIGIFKDWEWNPIYKPSDE